MTSPTSDSDRLSHKLTSDAESKTGESKAGGTAGVGEAKPFTIEASLDFIKAHYGSLGPPGYWFEQHRGVVVYVVENEPVRLKEPTDIDWKGESFPDPE